MGGNIRSEARAARRGRARAVLWRSASRRSTTRPARLCPRPRRGARAADALTPAWSRARDTRPHHARPGRLPTRRATTADEMNRRARLASAPCFASSSSPLFPSRRGADQRASSRGGPRRPPRGSATQPQSRRPLRLMLRRLVGDSARSHERAKRAWSSGAVICGGAPSVALT